MFGCRELSDGGGRKKLEQGSKRPPVFGCGQENDGADSRDQREILAPVCRCQKFCIDEARFVALFRHNRYPQSIRVRDAKFVAIGLELVYREVGSGLSGTGHQK